MELKPCKERKEQLRIASMAKSGCYNATGELMREQALQEQEVSKMRQPKVLNAIEHGQELT